MKFLAFLFLLIIANGNWVLAAPKASDDTSKSSRVKSVKNEIEYCLPGSVLRYKTKSSSALIAPARIAPKRGSCR